MTTEATEPIITLVPDLDQVDLSALMNRLIDSGHLREAMQAIERNREEYKIAGFSNFL